jgi:hypothetical protein
LWEAKAILGAGLSVRRRRQAKLRTMRMMVLVMGAYALDAATRRGD